MPHFWLLLAVLVFMPSIGVVMTLAGRQSLGAALLAGWLIFALAGLESLMR